eukprot:TRINITY_DN9832_c0_g1_i1.p1 TRINITY_DN9832_c0_g1~~TRINITY_DN9832_c0_g1_i1.p1  ORF type:complete len:576 (+),score=123.86 TRINITY_DN9832_c0_g1_i1:214-1728(+)
MTEYRKRALTLQEIVKKEKKEKGEQAGKDAPAQENKPAGTIKKMSEPTAEKKPPVDDEDGFEIINNNKTPPAQSKGPPPASQASPPNSQTPPPNSQTPPPYSSPTSQPQTPKSPTPPATVLPVAQKPLNQAGEKGNDQSEFILKFRWPPTSTEATRSFVLTRQWLFSWDSDKSLPPSKYPFVRAMFNLCWIKTPQGYVFEINSTMYSRYADDSAKWEDPMAVEQLNGSFTTQQDGAFVDIANNPLTKTQEPLSKRNALFTQWQSWAGAWCGLDLRRKGQDEEMRTVDTFLMHMGKKCVKAKKVIQVPGQKIDRQITFEAILELDTMRPHTVMVTNIASVIGTSKVVVEKQFFVFDWKDIITSNITFCLPSDTYDAVFKSAVEQDLMRLIGGKEPKRATEKEEPKSYDPEGGSSQEQKSLLDLTPSTTTRPPNTTTTTTSVTMSRHKYDEDDEEEDDEDDFIDIPNAVLLSEIQTLRRELKQTQAQHQREMASIKELLTALLQKK